MRGDPRPSLQRVLRHIEGREFHEKWSVAIRPLIGPDQLPRGMDGFRLVIAPRGHFFADPFLVEWCGRHFLFFEDYSFESSKGTIACCEVHEDGSTSEPITALERDHHLAYPFVFVWNGAVHLLPERADSRRLELYRAEEFPGPFRLESVLLHGTRAMDPTICHWQDRFWLFFNDFADGQNPWDNLHVLWAESPLGPWRRHPRNPVVRSRASSRPAGALFAVGGRLVRPAQDCSLRYGRAVVLNAVECLTTEEYSEVEIARIEPDWLHGNLGTHTYNRDSRFEVVDGRLYTSERPWLDATIRAMWSVVGGASLAHLDPSLPDNVASEAGAHA